VATVIVVDGYRGLPASLTAIICKANSTKDLRFRTPARLYLHDTLLERWPQDLQDVAAELRPFIQEEYAIVRQRGPARYWHVPAPGGPMRRTLGGEVLHHFYLWVGIQTG
jgi:hypothetical protein